VLASGGVFSEEPWKSWDYVEPYLRQIRGSIGIDDVQTVGAEGMNIPPLAIHAVPDGEKAIEALVIWRRKQMLDHMILTVSNVERSLAFYEAALKPLNIKFFLPYKGEGDLLDQAREAWSSVHSLGVHGQNNGKVDEFYRAAISAGAKDNISPRARVEYYAGYYAADIFDPDGYSFEVVHKN
jgi:catechol 2,3-dioxygenase-like lactoylglutathione lyase family enzyme